MSKESDVFVENLRGAFQYMGERAVEVYKRQLSKWTCSSDMWMTVLSHVITNAEPGRVPELQTIYDEIKRQQLIAKPAGNLGWVYFRRKGIDYAIRIYSDGNWRIKDLVSKDVNGVEIHHQQHVGELYFNHVPADYETFSITPDNPVRPDASEMPTPDEVKEYSHIIQANLAKFLTPKMIIRGE